MSDLGHSPIGENLSSVSPDTLRIPRWNKIKKNSDTSIIRQQPSKEPVNPRKRAKENTLTDVEKSSPKETTPSFLHKVDYEGDNHEKTHSYEDSPSGTDGFVRNLAKEHENEEDEEFKEDTSEINDTNESKLSKDKTK